MDFVFHCAVCHGPLVAHSGQRDLHILCEHCAQSTRVTSGSPVTDSLADTFLDSARPPGQRPCVLRRVRPAPTHSSAPLLRTRPLLTRAARISRGH